MAHGKLVPVVWAIGAQAPVQLAWASTLTSEAVVMAGARTSAPLLALRLSVWPL